MHVILRRALPDEESVPLAVAFRKSVTGLVGRVTNTDHVGAHYHRALPGLYGGGVSEVVSYRVTPKGV